MQNFLNIKSTSLLLFALPLLFACNSNSTSNEHVYQAKTISGNTQGTTYTIIADDNRIVDLQVEIDSILLDFDKCLSSYRDSSIISIFSNGAEEKYEFQDINGYFLRCFQLSEEIYKISNGAFDPSVFPLVSAWGFMKNPALEMTQNEVDSVKNLIGFNRNVDYQLTTTSKEKSKHTQFTLEKLRPSLKLDFNAIAQGLAVDVVYEYLEEQGFQNFYVEIGGELRVKGKNKEGQFWRIGIDVADENNTTNTENRQLQAVIAIDNKAVATSGSYRKFYEKDGVKRSHTINPLTGYPVQHSLVSATVLAENTATADAMATVFMVWGVEKTIAFVNENKQLKLEILLQYFDEKGKLVTHFSSGMEKLVLQ